MPDKVPPSDEHRDEEIRRLNAGENGVLGVDGFVPYTTWQRIVNWLPTRLVVAANVLAGRPVIYKIRLPWGFPVHNVPEAKHLSATISSCVFDYKWQWPEDLDGS